MKKRLLAGLVCLALALTLLPGAALAAPSTILVAGTEVIAGGYYLNDGSGITDAGAGSGNYHLHYDNIAEILYLNVLDLSGCAADRTAPDSFRYGIFADGDLTIELVGNSHNAVATADANGIDNYAVRVIGGSLTIRYNQAGCSFTANAGKAQGSVAGLVSAGIAVDDNDLLLQPAGPAATGGTVTGAANTAGADDVSNGISAGVYLPGPDYGSITVSGAATLIGRGGQALGGRAESAGVSVDQNITVQDSGVLIGIAGSAPFRSLGVAGLLSVISGTASLTGTGGASGGSSFGVFMQDGVDLSGNGRLKGVALPGTDGSYGVLCAGINLSDNGVLEGVGDVGPFSSGVEVFFSDLDLSSGTLIGRAPASTGRGIRMPYDDQTGDKRTITLSGGTLLAQSGERAVCCEDDGGDLTGYVTLRSGMTARTSGNYAGPGVQDYASGSPITASVKYFKAPADAPADVPKTGDDAPLILLCALVLLSAAGLTVSAIRRRRAKAR